MLETAARYGNEEVQNVRMLWNGDNNREIKAALDEHVRAGHLMKSDFHWSSPAQLRARFQQYPDARDTCAKEQPSVAQR